MPWVESHLADSCDSERRYRSNFGAFTSHSASSRHGENIRSTRSRSNANGTCAIFQMYLMVYAVQLLTAKYEKIWTLHCTLLYQQPTTLSRCAVSPTNPPNLPPGVGEMKDHVDALVYNLGSRESETPTTIFHLALPPQSSLVKEKMLASKV